MEIRLDRSEFLTELTPMQGIVERRTTIPILSHILLRAEGNRLHVAATDLDVSLTSSCGAEVKGEGGIAVQAKKFIEIIRALASQEVELVRQDEKLLSIVAGRSRFKIHGLAPDDFPTLPEVPKEHEIRLPTQQLKRMIGKVIFAVSAEESRFQLNGALLKLKGKAIELVATDGHRLALVENAMDGSGEEGSVLIPRKALQELLRFEGDETVVFRRSEHHLSFRLGQRELIGRILEGTFPDYERVIAKDNDKKVVCDRRLLAAAVQRVALLTGDRARAVRLQFGDDRVVISAANPDLGEAMEEVACKYAGPELKLGMNPDYLSQFLSVVESDEVRLELKDENSQCLGVPLEGPEERYLCVIMPMRV